MYKYVHSYESTPVFVCNDVLPEILSLFHPYQSSRPDEYERTIEFAFNFENLQHLGLISEVPETLSENLPGPVQFIVSPCSTALIFHYYSSDDFPRSLVNWLGTVIPYYIVFSFGLVHIGDYVFILDIWV